ncbi:phosphatase PAP2 family protein [Nocardia vinacea]|uniref:phosphatase PAP2 family protein n=1 Tax=Nocardia vinacea TaxID=96468 RepID=UPI0033D2999B
MTLDVSAGHASAPIGCGLLAALVTAAIGAAAMCCLAAVFAEILDNVLDGDGIASVDVPVATRPAAHRAPGFTGVMRILTEWAARSCWSSLWDWFPRLRLGGAAPPCRWASAEWLWGIRPNGVDRQTRMGRRRPPSHYQVVAVEGYSFPSGHATGVSVIGIISAWLLTRWCAGSRLARVTVWTTVLIVIAGVGFSRVYLGVHLSDIVAGWTLGALWVGSSSSPYGYGRHAHRT